MIQRISGFFSCLLLLRLYPMLILAIAIASCNNPDSKEKESANELPKVTGYNPFEKSKISIEVFKVDSIETNGSRGWGYDVMIDGKLYIHQPNIPAIMGNNGFSSEEKARIAGEFIVEKIRKNILPPSVTPEELDSIGVLD